MRDPRPVLESPTPPPTTARKVGRPRTGTLVYTKRHGYCLVVPTEVDGETVKKRHRLGTHNRAAARAKKARFVAGLGDGTFAPDETPGEARRAELVHEACERIQLDRHRAG